TRSHALPVGTYLPGATGSAANPCDGAGASTGSRPNPTHPRRGRRSCSGQRGASGEMGPRAERGDEGKPPREIARGFETVPFPFYLSLKAVSPARRDLAASNPTIRAVPATERADRTEQEQDAILRQNQAPDHQDLAQARAAAGRCDRPLSPRGRLPGRG